MRTFRPTSLAAIVVALPLMFAACNDTDTADPTAEANSAASAAAEAEGDGQALGALAYPADPSGAPQAPSLPLTAEERLARLKAFIHARLSCAEATASGESLTVVFSKDCTWSGRRWTGAVTITWAAGGDSADIDFEGVAVNGATLTGTMTVTRIEEGHVTVEADWTRVGPKHTVTGAWDGDYAWTDTTYTVNSATHVVTVDGHAATRTSTGVVWQRQDPSPEAGTVAFSGFRGKSWTMVFGRDESGALTITVTGPNGNTRVFFPGANT